jgi:hypothetical protein
MKLLLALLLIVHGLIVAAQSAGSFRPGSSIPNPSWLTWWPTNLGESWLLTRLGLERTAIEGFGGLLWLVGGIALVVAGLGVLGILVPAEWWRPLAIAGAAVSLFMLLVIYPHPFFVLGMGASLVILIALLWAHWPSAALVGS